MVSRWLGAQPWDGLNGEQVASGCRGDVVRKERLRTKITAW